MSEIILTVDTPVLKGEKGDKGDTGSFDYGELESIVERNLGDKFQSVEDKFETKVDKVTEKSLVDDKVIKTFDGLEKWSDNPFITKDENGENIEEPRTIVKMIETKIDNDDMDSKLKETKGELQNYIDEKMKKTGTGDMLSSDFDKDGDGVIDLAAHADEASTVNGKTVGTSVPENAVFTDTTYGEAAADKAGLMSAGDKVKLNGIASGATRVEVVDALDSIEVSKALSANQGKVLGDGIQTLGTDVTSINTRLDAIEDMSQPVLFEGKVKSGSITLNQSMYSFKFLVFYIKNDSSVKGFGYGLFPVIQPNRQEQSLPLIMGDPSDVNTHVTYIGKFSITNSTTLKFEDVITNVVHTRASNHSGATTYYVSKIIGIK